MKTFVEAAGSVKRSLWVYESIVKPVACIEPAHGQMEKRLEDQILTVHNKTAPFT